MSRHVTTTRPVRVTSEVVEKNIRQARDLDVQRIQLAAFGKDTANLLNAASAQTRIEQQRRLTSQLQSKNESIAEESMNKAAYERKYHQLAAQQNQAIASELEKKLCG